MTDNPHYQEPPNVYVLVPADLTNVGTPDHRRYEPVRRVHLIIVPGDLFDLLRGERATPSTTPTVDS
jgi:hypothetical protein